jgi:hypothetical protein
LLRATIPPRFADEDVERSRRFDDQVDNEGGRVRYEYSIPPSGALVVWRKSYADSSKEVETVFGPSAWEEVTGT